MHDNWDPFNPLYLHYYYRLIYCWILPPNRVNREEKLHCNLVIWERFCEVVVQGVRVGKEISNCHNRQIREKDYESNNEVVDKVVIQIQLVVGFIIIRVLEGDPSFWNYDDHSMCLRIDPHQIDNSHTSMLLGLPAM